MKVFIACTIVLFGVGMMNGCGFTNYPNSPPAQERGSSAPASPPGPVQLPPAIVGTPATFTQVYQQILQPKCLGCHDSGGSTDFSSYDTFAQNAAFVIAGNASQSVLYTAVSSGRMPKGGQALTQTEEAMIYSWIEAGALNN